MTPESIVQLESAGRRLAGRLFRNVRATGAIVSSFPCASSELATDVEVQLVAELCDIPAATAAQWIGAVAWARWTELARGGR